MFEPTTMSERSPPRPRVHEVGVGVGEALQCSGQQGEAERSRELLGEALATARNLGFGNIERRAVALLNRSSST
jgi:hypothetical protein